jgi:hypothetical protein
MASPPASEQLHRLAVFDLRTIQSYRYIQGNSSMKEGNAKTDQLPQATTHERTGTQKT